MTDDHLDYDYLYKRACAHARPPTAVALALHAAARAGTLGGAHALTRLRTAARRRPAARCVQWC